MWPWNAFKVLTLFSLCRCFFQSNYLNVWMSNVCRICRRLNKWSTENPTAEKHSAVKRSNVKKQCPITILLYLKPPIKLCVNPTDMAVWNILPSLASNAHQIGDISGVGVLLQCPSSQFTRLCPVIEPSLLSEPAIPIFKGTVSNSFYQTD